MTTNERIVLCPGQGAQSVGMGRAWAEISPAAKSVFDEADAILGHDLGAPLSELCFEGPAETLNRTNVSQPAIYTCSVACATGLAEVGEIDGSLRAVAGLSLGEYTALHLAGVFGFAEGLRLVATRGRLMQEAAEASAGTMVAVIGGTDEAGESLCEAAREGGILVPANYNAPGQLVLSGDEAACGRAAALADERGLRSALLTVAGAFHSPLMQPAADAMAVALAEVDLTPPNAEVWSNVTASPHDPSDMELLRRRLVEQIVSPVRWSQTCQKLPSGDTIDIHELAPGNVLRGLMRRIDRKKKVTNHDQPPSRVS